MINQIAVHDPTGSSEWTNWTSLYDAYKVVKFTMKFFPTNNINATVAAESSPPTLYGPLYLIWDFDSSTGPGSVTLCLNYGSLHVKSLYRNWSYTVQNPQVATDPATLATAATIWDPQHGVVLDMAQAGNYARGIVAWVCDSMFVGGASNVNMGELFIERKILLLGRR